MMTKTWAAKACWTSRALINSLFKGKAAETSQVSEQERLGEMGLKTLHDLTGDVRLIAFLVLVLSCCITDLTLPCLSRFADFTE